MKQKRSVLKHQLQKKTTGVLLYLSPRLGRILLAVMAGYMAFSYVCTPVLAVEDMWTAGTRIIQDVYGKIAGISTVLAGLMTVVAVLGAKVSSNQHKVDSAWDWLKRIWIAWIIINGIGAFISYIAPLFSGLATLTPGASGGGTSSGGDGGTSV